MKTVDCLPFSKQKFPLISIYINISHKRYNFYESALLFH